MRFTVHKGVYASNKPVHLFISAVSSPHESLARTIVTCREEKDEEEEEEEEQDREEKQEKWRRKGGKKRCDL